jgi:hypothetical protein
VVGAKLRSLELGSAPGSGPCLGESVGEPSLVIIVLEKCFTLDCSRSRARCKMLEAKMSPPLHLHLICIHIKKKLYSTENLDEAEVDPECNLYASIFRKL